VERYRIPTSYGSIADVDRHFGLARSQRTTIEKTNIIMLVFEITVLWRIAGVTRREPKQKYGHQDNTGNCRRRGNSCSNQGTVLCVQAKHFALWKSTRERPVGESSKRWLDNIVAYNWWRHCGGSLPLGKRSSGGVVLSTWSASDALSQLSAPIICLLHVCGPFTACQSFRRGSQIVTRQPRDPACRPALRG